MQAKINEFEIETDLIDEIYSKKTILISDLFENNINNGEFVIFKSTEDQQKTAVLYASKGYLKLINTKKLNTNGIVPKDVNQTVYLNLLKDPDFQIVLEEKKELLNSSITPVVKNQNYVFYSECTVKTECILFC